MIKYFDRSNKSYIYTSWGCFFHLERNLLGAFSFRVACLELDEVPGVGVEAWDTGM